LKKNIEIFAMQEIYCLILHSQTENSSSILWGDEIFGRHALSSRGWGQQDKRSIEPSARKTGVDHRTLYYS